MIESCTKKRMLLAVTLLGGLTVLVLIIESHWTDSSNGKPFVVTFENNATCPAREGYDVVSECHPCTSFETASGSVGICVRARYKEVLRCKNGEKITRSCDKVAWLEERSFWKFEGLTCALSVISCMSVFWRESVLRNRVIRRVAKQLRNSV